MTKISRIIISLFIISLLYIIYHLKIKEPDLPKAPVGYVDVFIDQASGSVPEGYTKLEFK